MRNQLLTLRRMDDQDLLTEIRDARLAAEEAAESIPVQKGPVSSRIVSFSLDEFVHFVDDTVFHLGFVERFEREAKRRGLPLSDWPSRRACRRKADLCVMEVGG